MASEDQIINVDGFSSSDDEQNWVDVGADDGLDPSEMESGTDEGMDDFSDDGSADGQRARKGHHNELEKKRRKTLNASYSDLKRMVKRLYHGSRVGGRDRSLELSFKYLTSKWRALKSEREKCKTTIEALKQMLAEQTDEAERKETEEHIKKLTEVSENKLEIRGLGGEAGENSQEDAEANSDDEEEEEEDDNDDIEEEDDNDDDDNDDDDDNNDNDVSDEEEHYTDASSLLSGQNGDDEYDPTPCSSPTGKDP